MDDLNFFETTEQKPKKSSPVNLLFAVIIIAALGAMGFLGVTKMAEHSSLQDEIKDLEARRDSPSLKNTLEEIKSLRADISVAVVTKFPVIKAYEEIKNCNIIESAFLREQLVNMFRNPVEEGQEYKGNYLEVFSDKNEEKYLMSLAFSTNEVRGSFTTKNMLVSAETEAIFRAQKRIDMSFENKIDFDENGENGKPELTYTDEPNYSKVFIQTLTNSEDSTINSLELKRNKKCSTDDYTIKLLLGGVN